MKLWVLSLVRLQTSDRQTTPINLSSTTTREQTMSRSNFLDRLQQVSPGIVPFMAANTRGGRADITDSGNKGKGIGGGGGIPGSGNGGGNGGGSGRPTSEGAGNNLSFPAYFPDEKPILRALGVC